MSSDVFVRARGVCKSFMMSDSPWRRLAAAALRRDGGTPFWAVRDVDLDLRPGECVGIIGRNGAGKSTLLELVCGVLHPTAGSIETHGRIAALLQLGIGFNPDFTGRENVFLAGAVLGLTSREIKDRFETIADFAEIGAFMDRPVRDYSSGMVARLAFSVCAQADPDILVVDEILGVGDIRFQQKAMRFLRAFRRRGILLFVSHNEHSVAALCDRAIWLDRGRVAAQGPTRSVLAAYRREVARLMRPDGGFEASGRSVSVAPGWVEETPEPCFDPDDPPPPVGGGRIIACSLTHGGRTLAEARGGEDVCLQVHFRLFRKVGSAQVAFALRNPRGQVVLGEFGEAAESVPEGAPGEWRCAFRFALPYLPSGGYGVDVFLLEPGPGAARCLDARTGAATFLVASTHVSGGMANVRMSQAELFIRPGGGAHG